MQAGYVLHLCIKFEADSSIRSKVIMGVKNFEIVSRDPGHAYLGVVLYSLCRRERCKHYVLAVVRRSKKISPHRRPPSRGRKMAKI